MGLLEGKVAIITGAGNGLGEAYAKIIGASSRILANTDEAWSYASRGELVPLFCENGLPTAETAGIYALRLEQQANARSRLLLEYLKSRFSPVPPWDLALQSGWG